MAANVSHTFLSDSSAVSQNIDGFHFNTRNNFLAIERCPSMKHRLYLASADYTLVFSVSGNANPICLSCPVLPCAGWIGSNQRRDRIINSLRVSNGRSFDLFSGGVYFNHEFGDDRDWISEQSEPWSGTLVWMKLGNHTARTCKRIFDQYSSADRQSAHDQMKRTVEPEKNLIRLGSLLTGKIRVSHDARSLGRCG